MKFLKFALLVSMTSAGAAFAGGGTVGSDKIEIQNVRGFVCRAGNKYWASNKGFEIDLARKEITFYKDNGFTKGKSEPVECRNSGNTVQCQTEDMTLIMPDIQKLSVHVSSDAEDFLGSIVGVSAKRATVTPGVLHSKGIFFDSEKPVVCIIE